ncbi:YqgQ family protein [Barrientosiimonas marina]|uniref:YqgQ family protein n=1 Tax=Lentibacillus kimchii TaxID=1542911 RepID=A0ABW2UW74_9BACI
MKTIYDVQQLLKKFGTIIYIGDRLADLELMEDEIKELYRLQCIGTKEYQEALLLLRGEISRLGRAKGEETNDINNRN